MPPLRSHLQNALLGASLLLLLWAAPLSAAEKPNVIFILADDLGIGNMSCYGADRDKTPRLDQLASGGARFTHCYTAALCGPSRALIMSGRYAFRNGSTNQDACIRMDPKEIVTPRLFKEAGYATAHFGKWGQLPGEPEDHAFDEVLRFQGSGVYWGKKADGKKEVRYQIHGEERLLGGTDYLPDLMHQHLMEFVTKHQAEPFFAYYSMSHVHGELVPTPDSQPGSTDLMADNVAYMDKLVGQLVDGLEALHLREKTLLLFMGDNGTGSGQADRSTIGGKPISGSKGTMQEGGGLVPMIANWPGTIAPGAVNAKLIDSTDFLPTFAELSGGRLPVDRVFDGHSFLPQLRGQAGQTRPWIFNQLASMWYVREADWKLNQAGELFDMRRAPFEETLVPTDSSDPLASAARTRLAGALAQLNPAGGIPDTGDGSGRHANKAKKKKGN